MSKHEDRYDDDYDVQGPDSATAKTLKGYKTVIVLMAVVLAAVSGLYFFQSWRQHQEFAIERDTLTTRIMAVRNDLAGLRTTNDALNQSIAVEKGRTDSVLDALARERNISRATIRRYEKELGTLRTAMRGYVYTIDSLGKLNTRLISENLGMKSEIKSERLRADAAEERAADADIKIRQGARILARGIGLVLLNANDKPVTRTARAARVRIDFTLAANSLTNPGVRSVWARITGPDGYVLANAAGATFDFEGDKLVYSAVRDDVDYQNDDLEVSIYYRGKGLVAGNYRTEIYVDGMLAGSTETLLR